MWKTLMSNNNDNKSVQENERHKILCFFLIDKNRIPKRVEKIRSSVDLTRKEELIIYTVL